MTGYSAYRRVQNVSDTPRAIERRLIGEVTAALIGAKDNPTDIPRLIDALLWNKQVWDHFMIDLNDEDNKLPIDSPGRARRRRRAGDAIPSAARHGRASDAVARKTAVPRERRSC